jgi:zinc and cadmium transporter
MHIYYAIISVIVVSLVSLVGLATIPVKPEYIKRHIYIIVSLAVGALLGDAFIHLLPEGFEIFDNKVLFSLLIIAGILIFFIIEKYLHWHHHGEDEEHDHPVGKMVLLSDSIHNLIDGMIIASSYMISVEVGIATTLAVILHEIPQEIGDFGILMHYGYSKSRALWLNFISALTAVVGALIVFLIGQNSETVSLWLIPIAGGGFIYIALSDLIPELHKKSGNLAHSLLQIIMILIGVGTMLTLLAVGV